MATPLTPKIGKRQGVISHSKDVMDRYNLLKNMPPGSDEEDSDDDVIDDLYEDISESEPTSPTPAERYTGPRPAGGETLRAVDGQWAALESEKAHEDILVRVNKILDNQYNEGYQRNDAEERFRRLGKESKETSEAVKGLSIKAASQLTALTSKVDLLVKSRSQDPLERKVEELSGQLVSVAQRMRQ